MAGDFFHWRHYFRKNDPLLETVDIDRGDRSQNRYCDQELGAGEYSQVSLSISEILNKGDLSSSVMTPNIAQLV